MSNIQYFWIGLIILAGVALLFVVMKFVSNRSRSKKMKYYKSQWGKAIDKHRLINEISIYNNYKLNENDYQIDDKTWQDLDMDKVFSRVDATVSRIGEQKLYQTLHSLKFNKEELKEFDKRVEYFNENETIRTNVQLILDKLNSPDLYFFPTLFSDKIPSKPRFSRIYPLLCFLDLIVIIICFIKP